PPTGWPRPATRSSSPGPGRPTTSARRRMTDGTGKPAPGPEPDDADFELWNPLFGDDSQSLAELVNRLLDKGVVITGDVTISIAGVDLVYLGLNAVLTSVSTARDQLHRDVGTADHR